MLEVRKLFIKKNSEDRQLISNLSFTLNKGDKFAIIGLEGNGKSTLLKAILGHELDFADVQGTIRFGYNKLGYLPQSVKQDFENENVIDFLLKDTKESQVDIDDYALLGLLEKILKEVRFDLDAFHDEKNISEFSGGEVVKLGLAKILLRDPDILLLDEPTNDLDLDTILFLEEFIQSEKRPILFISHDEALLKNTANGIIHLTIGEKKRKARSFFEKISYEMYVQSRKLALDSQEMKAKKQRSNFNKKMERYRQIYQKVEHLQNQTVRDPSAARLLAKKVKSLKSTEKRYQKEQDDFIDIPEREEEINIFFDEYKNIPSNKKVVDYHKDVLDVEGIVLSKNIDLLVKGPSKIAIVGKNGCGKTTLLKDIYSSIINRNDIQVGYMPQYYDEYLKNYNRAVDVLLDCPDLEKETKYRKMLGALHFTREEMVYSPVSLSGGQKAKLFLLKMVIDGANVLILDEPTRNLSPLSIPVIHQLLLNFKGTIISVTHDRTFLDNVFDDVYVLNEEGLHEL